MTVIEDFRLAFRALSKRSGIGVVVIMTLGVAMAGSVVIFSAIDLAVNGLVPIAQTDGIVFLESTSPQRAQTRIGVSLPDFMDWRAQNTSFEQLGRNDGDTPHSGPRPDARGFGRCSARGLNQSVHGEPVLARADSYRQEDSIRGAEYGQRMG